MPLRRLAAAGWRAVVLGLWVAVSVHTTSHDRQLRQLVCQHAHFRDVGDAFQVPGRESNRTFHGPRDCSVPVENCLLTSLNF